MNKIARSAEKTIMFPMTNMHWVVDRHRISIFLFFRNVPPTSTPHHGKGVPYMIFLCRPWYFMQLLAEQNWFLTPSPHGDGGLANVTFYLVLNIFVLFTKTFLLSEISQGQIGVSRRRLKWVCMHVQSPYIEGLCKAPIHMGLCNVVGALWSLYTEGLSWSP